MKIIITGSEGFVGRTLAASLFDQGYQIIRVDRAIGIEAGDFFTGADLSDVDVVFHLAAQTSVFNRNKSDIIHDNIEVFKTVCDACSRAGTRLIYASSSTAANGNTTSLYGISKLFDEQYARCYNPTATGVRFHNVYGSNPRQGTLLWHLLHDKRVKLYNDGLNERHFTYIADIIRGLLYVMEHHGLPPVVNIANPERTTTRKFVETACKYKPIEFECVKECRNFDRKEQKVENSIYTLPLQYTSVEQGLRLALEKA